MTPTNTYKRYLWLINLLLERGALTKEQIDDAWAQSILNDSHEPDIPRRTFMRMKETIGGDMFHVDIECRRSTNQYYIANLQEVLKDSRLQWQLNAFYATQFVQDSEDIKDKILIETAPIGNQHLQSVVKALREQKRINITYQNYWMREPRQFDIEPYCLRFFRGRWYMLAKSCIYNELRLYALDRILQLQMLDAPYKIPKDFSAEEYFSHYFGIMAKPLEGMPDKPQIIRLWANSFRASYLRSLPLHRSQKEVETTTDGAIFEYFLVPTIDFIQELRTYATEVRIIQPSALAELMRYDAKTVVSMYD